MTLAFLSCVAFLVMTIGVCGLVRRLITFDTIEHDVYHLWEEYGYTKDDYLNGEIDTD